MLAAIAVRYLKEWRPCPLNPLLFPLLQPFQYRAFNTSNSSFLLLENNQTSFRPVNIKCRKGGVQELHQIFSQMIDLIVAAEILSQLFTPPAGAFVMLSHKAGHCRQLLAGQMQSNALLQHFVHASDSCLCFSFHFLSFLFFPSGIVRDGVGFLTLCLISFRGINQTILLLNLSCRVSHDELFSNHAAD